MPSPAVFSATSTSVGRRATRRRVSSGCDRGSIVLAENSSERRSCPTGKLLNFGHPFYLKHKSCLACFSRYTYTIVVARSSVHLKFVFCVKYGTPDVHSKTPRINIFHSLPCRGATYNTRPQLRNYYVAQCMNLASPSYLAANSRSLFRLVVVPRDAGRQIFSIRNTIAQRSAMRVVFY